MNEKSPLNFQEFCSLDVRKFADGSYYVGDKAHEQILKWEFTDDQKKQCRNKKPNSVVLSIYAGFCKLRNEYRNGHENYIAPEKFYASQYDIAVASGHSRQFVNAFLPLVESTGLLARYQSIGGKTAYALLPASGTQPSTESRVTTPLSRVTTPLSQNVKANGDRPIVEEIEEGEKPSKPVLGEHAFRGVHKGGARFAPDSQLHLDLWRQTEEMIPNAKSAGHLANAIRADAGIYQRGLEDLDEALKLERLGKRSPIRSRVKFLTDTLRRFGHPSYCGGLTRARASV